MKAVPTSDLELKLRDLWSKVLCISPDLIGRDDNFSRIGGDYIAAIRLVSLAQSQALCLHVSAIFSRPRLGDMALECLEEATEFQDVEPFSLLPLGKNTLFESAIRDLQLPSVYGIEDAYPISPFQDALMALSAKQPGTCPAHICFRLSKEVDIERFRAAWEETLTLCPNLRTRIIRSKGVPLRLILRNNQDWEQHGTFGDLKDHLSSHPLTCDSKLCRYTIIQEVTRITSRWSYITPYTMAGL
jgi:hypothetical protein